LQFLLGGPHLAPACQRRGSLAALHTGHGRGVDGPRLEFGRVVGVSYRATMTGHQGLTRDNINGEQFVNLLRLLRAAHPETERFVLYLDRARYYGAPVVQAWLRRRTEFELEPLPTYSPNLNL